MTRDEIISKVAKAVGKIEAKMGSIRPGVSFVDDLGFDSLDPTELIMMLEDDFGVAIPELPEDLRILTVGGMAVAVETAIRKRGAKAP